MTEQTLTQAAKPTGSPQSTKQNLTFFRQERLEPFLVVVTAAAIAASLLAERLGAPESVILPINIISYIAGGWFGLRAGIYSLLHREINVDLLMVLAAAGAAIVNQWHEGAI